MSFNRIRELERASFEKYTDIRYLYLFENMIQTVEPGTFAQLTSLEAIDLSSNALTTIPLELLDVCCTYLKSSQMYIVCDDYVLTGPAIGYKVLCSVFFADYIAQELVCGR